jgi:outer membrane lipoprotein-sorting protein
MTNKKIWLAALLVIAVVFLGGCTKKMAEKTTERAIEKNIGSQANVDLGSNQVTIETEQGTYQGGENLSLPSNFPDDIYVIDGKIIALMNVNDDFSHSLTISANKSVAEIKADYENKLKDKGWKIELQMDYGESAVVSASKADRTVTVSITDDNEGTTVTIVTGKN